MVQVKSSDIVFGRLKTLSPDTLLAHMSDPRIAAHLPLKTGEWDRQVCEAFIKDKEACWQRDGLGHWAIQFKGEYVGWGGFQKEGNEWDFGLVLRSDRFGLGFPITRKALEFARSDPRIPHVTFLLPLSRRHLGALDRVGARYIGDTDIDGVTFRKFCIETT